MAFLGFALMLVVIPLSAQTYTVLHDFNGADGAMPDGTLTMDRAGTLYGGTSYGTSGWGSVYELSSSGSGWIETTLYAFHNHGDGFDPLGGAAFDQAGNFYGTTFNDGGRVYQLSLSGGTWTYSSLYYFNGYEGSFSGPTVDAAGNVYGVMSIPSLVSKLTLRMEAGRRPTSPISALTLFRLAR
jgi:hypothetical protein